MWVADVANHLTDHLCRWKIKRFICPPSLLSVVIRLFPNITVTLSVVETLECIRYVNRPASLGDFTRRNKAFWLVF